MMDYGFQVYHPSLFRCLLRRAMSPPDQFGCCTFQHLFASLVTQPGLYTEKIDWQSAEHPAKPFQPCTGDTITIIHLSLASENVANMTLNDVVSTLCNNHILVGWINHSYAYRLQYVSEQLTSNSRHVGLMEDTDDECVPHLELHGQSPTLPKWDGW
jgi:hypothetical protein